MSNRRLVLISAAGAILVGGALWYEPPEFLSNYFAPPQAESPGAGEGGAVTAAAPDSQAAEDTASVNPLHGLDLSQFAELVDRPLFNPTRAGAPKVEPEAPEPVVETPPPEVEKTAATAADFTLMAVSISDAGTIAMVRVNRTNEVFRLKPGQYLLDWTVSSIEPREMTLKRDAEDISLKLFEVRSQVVAETPDINPAAQPAESGEAASGN